MALVLTDQAKSDLRSIDDPVHSKIEKEFQTIEMWPTSNPELSYGRRYCPVSPFVILYSITPNGDIVIEQIVHEHSNWK
ncbi:MAG: type II toxin-antitoxin system RelE/ParE family toxin [Oscillospiraceae bacterium]|nr:type II toxin-antitoxin system RelE/ParE family toxin [Oscillospiraceae bacterium]